MLESLFRVKGSASFDHNIAVFGGERTLQFVLYFQKIRCVRKTIGRNSLDSAVFAVDTRLLREGIHKQLIRDSGNVA